MRIQYLGSAAGLSLAIFLSACGGSGSSSDSSAEAPSPARSSAISAAETSADISPEDASRLAKQASFGPTLELINAIVAKKSASAWLDDQLSLSTSTYADMAGKPVTVDYCASKYTGNELAYCNRDNFSATPVQMRFYANAMNGNDQVRQRVAFALSQIIVTSEMDQDLHNTAGLATFNQILLANAFGNYRDILKAVTLNPYMGSYLDMVDSDKAQPNENYAREFMQLFSIGVVLLNEDGTAQTDNTGATIATYGATDVKEVARALTGWTWSRLNGASLTDYNKRDWSRPMTPYAARFDTGSKTFLGRTVAAGATQEANVDAVIDAVFNHPNAAPFISKRLIQQLVVANPSPAYVGRVAAVFVNNGSGVRGDLKAVVRAIYLDNEARVVAQTPGKVKEPVLLTTSLSRAIGFKTDGYVFLRRDVALGQSPFRATSVFNFYPYDFPLAQSGGLVSPVSKLMTPAAVIARHNFTYDWTVDGDASRIEYTPATGMSISTGTVPQWSTWEANGADDGKTIDRINLVLMNGTMTPAQRRTLLTAMGAIKNADPAVQARRRAQMALYIVASSPFFQVDR